MKSKISRMWRSGVALLLALCLVAGFLPTVAFATEAEETINYVSLGDSMTNGYGLDGYRLRDGDRLINVNGYLQVADAAYPALFRDYLEEEHDATVELTQLAMSGMRADEVYYLLTYGSENVAYADHYTQIAGFGRFNDVDFEKIETGASGTANVAKKYQDSVKNADVISIGLGYNNFGTFLTSRLCYEITQLGFDLGGTYYETDLEALLAIVDSELASKGMDMYNELMVMLKEQLIAKGISNEFALHFAESMAEVGVYSYVGYVISYKGILDYIAENNPDAEVMIVGMANSLSGLYFSIPSEEGEAIIIDMGEYFGYLINSANAYTAALPAAYDIKADVDAALGNENDYSLTVYYAPVGTVNLLIEEIAKANFDGYSLLRERIMEKINQMVFPLVGINNVTLSIDKVVAVEKALNADANAGNETAALQAVVDAISQLQMSGDELQMYVQYLGLEKAVINASGKNVIDANSIAALIDEEKLGSLFGSIKGKVEDNVEEKLNEEAIRNAITEVAGGNNANDQTIANVTLVATANVTPDCIAEAMDDTTLNALLHMLARFLIGEGIGCHPSEAGYATIEASMEYVYGNGITAKDTVVENIEDALEDLYKLVETYGPEVAAQVWNQWVEDGYVDHVNGTIAELENLLKTRYEYYTTEALPAIEDAVDALAGKKDGLTNELAALKVQLEAKKAELEKVISEQEIGSIHTPNIDIDAELGNNEQTTVPDHECVVDGEGIEAELNAAIKDIEHAIATIEALIADIEADIEDMIALAEQIAAAVAELEKTMADIAAAAEDLANAVQAVVEVLANSDEVIDAVISTFEAGRDTALAAAEVLELTMGVAEDMMGDIDEMIEIIVTDAEDLYNKFLTNLPGYIDQIPEEGKMLIGGAILAAQKGLEEGKKLIEAELPGKIAELEAEYADDLAALKAEYEGKITQAEADLEALKAQVQNEIDAKYAEVSEQIKAEYNAQIVELEAQLEALEAELQGYKTELENLAADAEEAVRQQLQAQIDRVTGDIATVKEDLECALEHLENALQIAYEEIVAEVTAIYEEAMAELQKAADDLKAALEQAAQELKDALDKAVEELKAAADKAIEDLTAEYEKLVAELEKIGEELSAALNGILESIRDELTAAQQAIEEILKGNLEAVEALADALAALGAEALAELVEDIVAIVEAMLEEATTADLVIDDDFKYVAIGDGSAATESYVEKLAAALNAEAAENGVDEIEVANNAKAGNTVAAERANLSDVSDADLITVGFSNVEFLDKAVVSALNGVAMDWSVIVGEENVHYIDELMAEVADMVAEAGVEGENAVLINTAIEAYAYAAVQYATELPELINDIHAANSEALIIIVGMYNPMKGVTIALDENTTLDIGEYIDYLVQGVAVHGTAYAILTGNAIYVDAPSVDTENVDTELSILELATMAYYKFVALYPSATGDDYVAEEIADALNITYIKSEPTGLLGDADSNGVVNIRDAMLVAQYANTQLSADNLNLAVCDVDGNDVVNIRDAMLIAQYANSQLTKFPVE